MKRINKTTKIFCAILAIFVFIGAYNKTHAADLSVSAGNTTLSSGESTTITISSQYTGRVNISATGGTLSESKLWLENSSGSVTYTATSDGGGTITVAPADSEGMSNSKGDTVPVGAKSVSISGKSQTSNNNNSNTQAPEKTASFSSTNQTVYATGTVNVRSGCSTSSSVVGSLKEGDSVTRIGIGDNGWSKVTYNGSTCYISSTYLTTQKKDKPDEEEEKDDEDDEKSSDTTLKSLEITPKGISPEFKPETTTYSLEINSNIEKLEIKATPNNEKSKVSITGNDSLKIGDNTVKITVTSEDGKTKTYTINVKKKDKAATVSLKTLKLDKYTLTPSFSSDVHEYKISITDTDISKLDLSAIANEENAKVEITGNENLKNGQNVITITVTSANGEDEVVYKIYANISQATTLSQKIADTTDNNKSKLPLYVGGGIIGLLIIVMIAIIVKNKRNNELYDEDYDEENENYEDENKDDIYDFKSKSFNLDDTNSSAITEENDIHEDLINQTEDFANTYKDNANEEESKLTDIFEKNNDLSDKDKIREDYLNQFNFNPYSEEGSADVENTTEDSYKDLYGTTAYENSSENNYLSTDVDYNYKPKKSKGKHSM